MKACTFFFLLLLPFFLPGQSDECARFDDMIKKAEQALRAEDYQTTLIRLNEAKNTYCYEKNMQADEWIEKLFKTMETKTRNVKREMEKAKDDPARFPTCFAAYLTLEAEMAFLREDIRLSWWLILEALEKDPNNEKAQHLKQELPGYGTDFFLEVLEEFWRAEISPDSAYFSFFTKEADGSNTLNVLELRGDKAPEIFPNSYNRLYSGSYSLDSRYLAFYTNVADNVGTLNVLDLEGNEPLLTFPNSTNFYGAKYSPDSRYLVFFTKEADGSYTLNVLELGGNKSPLIFPSSYYYNCEFSPDGRHLAFLAGDRTTTNILDVDSKKIAQQIKNQYPVKIGMTFLDKNNLLVSSIKPVTENVIFKIINLERIGEGYWDYLTKERYAPLTAEEKRAYGIME